MACRLLDVYQSAVVVTSAFLSYAAKFSIRILAINQS
jgi:hypothetical protein